MLESIEFRNYKILHNTKLPLGAFTLIVGPNGSGKTTALAALDIARNPGKYNFHSLMTAGLEQTPQSRVELILRWGKPFELTLTCSWTGAGQRSGNWTNSRGEEPKEGAKPLVQELQRFRVFLFNPIAISAGVALQPDMELGVDGTSLVGVLDRLRDRHPERYEAIKEQVTRWIPEYDRIIFDIDDRRQRIFGLRTRRGGHIIPAPSLSQGTLFALALLTLAYLPEPPPLIAIEEPEHGLHPRLLRDVRDALYRLSHPEAAGESRSAVQVVVTSHSPYFLDLFKDHPEEVVIAEKLETEVQFHRLTERPDIEDILADVPLGEAWFSGVLGGVPAKT